MFPRAIRSLATYSLISMRHSGGQCCTRIVFCKPPWKGGIIKPAEVSCPISRERTALALCRLLFTDEL